MTDVAAEGLTVAGPAGPVVEDVTLRVGAGELLALVGESGAGKTTTALALLGHLAPGLRRVAGTVTVGGVDPLALDGRGRRRLRADTVGYVPQAAGGGLNPRMRVGAIVGEALRGVGRTQRRERVGRALGDAGLDGVAGVARRYPHQLSGGQQQRVAIAAALVGDPDVLVLDEPTSGLDPTTQAQILAAIDELRRRRPRAILLISHDLAIVAGHSDRVAVMRAGRVVEQGPTRPLLTAPAEPFTRELRDAVADLHAPARARETVGDAPVVLAAEGLRLVHGRRARAVVAAEDVSLRLPAGGCVALVGESGSGKTTIARALAGLHPPAAGTLRLGDAELPAALRRRSRDELRAVQLVPQDPQETLNPRRLAGDGIDRTLLRLRGLDGAERTARRDALLEQVGLDPALAGRHPGALSGGERQRVAIARALAAEPAVLICDEVTSALDARTQARVVALLDDLRERTGVALLLITHELGLAAAVADHTIVLRAGRVHADGPTDAVLRAPADPYTQALLEATPSLSRALGSAVVAASQE